MRLSNETGNIHVCPILSSLNVISIKAPLVILCDGYNKSFSVDDILMTNFMVLYHCLAILIDLPEKSCEIRGRFVLIGRSSFFLEGSHHFRGGEELLDSLIVCPQIVAKDCAIVQVSLRAARHTSPETVRPPAHSPSAIVHHDHPQWSMRRKASRP
jgi:hypothetical protein